MQPQPNYNQQHNNYNQQHYNDQYNQQHYNQQQTLSQSQTAHGVNTAQLQQGMDQMHIQVLYVLIYFYRPRLTGLDGIHRILGDRVRLARLIKCQRPMCLERSAQPGLIIQTSQRCCNSHREVSFKVVHTPSNSNNHHHSSKVHLNNNSLPFQVQWMRTLRVKQLLLKLKVLRL